jgi:transposase
LQARALAALLACRTVAEAAKVAGVGESTLRRWLGTDPFSSAYRAAARDAARQATTALLAAQTEAVQVLRSCLREGSPATRVRAARALLELGVRVAADDMDERLSQLEEEVRQWETSPGLRLA